MSSQDTVTRRTARRGWAALVGVLCTLLCGLFLTSSYAAISPTGYYGANIQPLIKLSLAQPSGWNGFIADMGTDSLHTARMDALWSWAEPKAPVNGLGDQVMLCVTGALVC